MTELTPEQGEAFSAAVAFATAGSVARPWFELHGLAGTGKTEVLAALARRFPSATTCAFTGKAAAVLRARTGLEVRTVHSVIYSYLGTAEDESDPTRRQPIFVSKETDLRRELVLLDEASTVGRRLADELLATGARVIACGDPGQLPPVADEQFFVDPDQTLETVHRQALDSGIVRQAHRVRRGLTVEPDGDDVRVVTGVRPSDLVEADAVLCWRNATRKTFNAARRAALGFSGETVRAGEPVMCLRNDHSRRLYNGEVYPVAADRAPGNDLRVLVDGRVVEVLNARVEGVDADFEQRRHEEVYAPFALAYALTVHKAQGSGFPRVIVLDEYARNAADRRQWIYTALTRASQRVTVVQR